MGLDQYAKVYEGDKDEGTEIAYWRKHPHLQGWMENLYREKGGEQDFNCVAVEVSEEDLDRLEEDIKAKGLPKTSGFFFGDDSSSHYVEQDLQFIEDARKAIAEGKKVAYSSWW